MKIIGFSIESLKAEKIKPAKGNLELKSGLTIEDIKQETNEETKQTVLDFKFSFIIDYSPNIAKIEFKGIVRLLDEKDEGKEIIKDWKKKKFVHAVKLGLFNFIMERCNIKALKLEEELSLPFHIPFPKLTAQKQSDKADNSASYAG